MSTNLPPTGPPGPPPPPPPGSAEFLESGGGRPIDPDAASSGGTVRKALLIGGGVVGAVAIGVGAWAAVSFLATGPQPAEALPDTTLAYLSVDLDPSGGQKIEALRTLNKFPAFEDEVGIDSDDDIREWLFDRVQEGSGCDDLDYEDDIEPWLGDRAAVAAVDTGEDTPTPVFVLQVKDADAAEAGLEAIRDCAGGVVGEDDGDQGGWAIEGEWAVIAESDEIAEGVSDDAAEASLADDDDFQTWTGEAGDSGIVTMYAAPALGGFLAEHADSLFGFPFAGIGGAVDCLDPESPADGDYYETCVGDPDAVDDGGASDEMAEVFEDFGGVAAVLRFDDGAVELEFAGGKTGAYSAFYSGDGTGETISGLPDDTAAVLGVAFADDWLETMIDEFGAGLGAGDPDELFDEIEAQTGLALPDDIETLLGDAAVLAVGSDIDPDAVMDSEDGADVPIALKVDGDPDEVEKVLDKLRDQFPPGDTLVFDSDSAGDTIVIGPNADYRERLLEDGDLGDNDVFKDVVREADDASTVMFVNINELEDLIEELADGDEDLVENVKPLSGVGMSAWLDGDVAHAVMRVTTD